jgi:hypothetical protein
VIQKLILGGLAVLTATASAGAVAQADPAPAPPAQPGDVAQAIRDGQPILDVRSRYEDVDQANLAQLGQSFTTRVQAGWQTAPYDGFQVLVEFAGLFHADDAHYNIAIPGGASLNGRTEFPIIDDPTFATLNRAQLSWTPDKHLKVTVGRQRILIDDQRFVGNAGWRQDEQRFDAAKADFSWGKLSATYVYVWRVDRIFGGQLDWNSNSHLLDVAYNIAPPLRLEGFMYALDFSNASPTTLANAAANGGLTAGARATGHAAVGPIKLAYDGTWARETDYRNQTAPYALDFWQADVSATYAIATARIDYEQLNGNGKQGFITPIATTHIFQGWADAFAADAGNKTEVDGIRDANYSVALSPDWKVPFLSQPQAIVRYYDFHAELTGAYIANEWDAQVQAQITRGLTAQVTYAEFQRARAVPVGTVAAPPSRTKIWLSLEYKL